MEYIVVEKDNVIALTETVNALIKEGYEPIGSHQVSTTLHAITYYSQTLIKRDPDSIESIKSKFKDLAKKADRFISESDFSKI